MSRERPSRFSGPMIRAILEGRKTQTRRVIKPQPVMSNRCGIPFYPDGLPVDYRNCPYGKDSERLWVRETWGWSGYQRIEYKAFPADGSDFRSVSRWRPSIHMPRWASRIALEVVNVRVEPLHYISEADAEAEGVSRCCPFDVCNGGGFIGGDESCRCADMSPAEVFAHRWDSINGKRGHSWDSNPWVWVIEFRRVQP